jgi:hypothetical protein
MSEPDDLERTGGRRWSDEQLRSLRAEFEAHQNIVAARNGQWDEREKSRTRWEADVSAKVNEMHAAFTGAKGVRWFIVQVILVVGGVGGGVLWLIDHLRLR